MESLVAPPAPAASVRRDERGPTQDEGRPSADEVAAPRTLIRLDDRWARWVGIPSFGIVIPNLTGLFGPLTHREPLYWLGYVWFITLAWAIWQGNRALLFAQRAHWDWFQHPVRKLTFLLSANVFYTAPITVAFLWAWFAVAPMGLDVPTVRTLVLVNVICVAFVTHGYETAFLIRERSDDHLDAERLRRAKAEAELATLRAQIDPHFMFNALNTLAQLVEAEPTKALRFTESLAEVYRYLLAQRDRDLVLLRDELAFLERYAYLLRIRFGDALTLQVEDPGDRAGRLLVPPAALQLLLENVVKHNRVDEPMVVRVVLEGATVRMSNPRRPKPLAESAGVGLVNLRERCALTTGRDLKVEVGGTIFTVTLPALELSG